MKRGGERWWLEVGRGQPGGLVLHAPSEDWPGEPIRLR